jgi:hypothetical protein
MGFFYHGLIGAVRATHPLLRKSAARSAPFCQNSVYYAPV